MADHERAEALEIVAERVAAQLIDALKAGHLAKIDIDVIRRALLAETEGALAPDDFEALEIMTTRKVVEKV